MVGVLVGAAQLLAVPAAQAARPAANGAAWSFAVDDEIAFVDSPSGHVRVHYAASGPSVTVLDDADLDGVPDLPQVMAQTAEQVLTTLTALGFRAPLLEADVGLEDLGGSAAIDVYMVDFAGTGDGRFAIDACYGSVCAGHLLTDNDFAESGYADAAEAARVLASHELFHAVQAAYAADLPAWMSEGTATWAEHLYDPETPDYLGLCRYYLLEPTRSLNSPPAGTVTGWSYGTALFFGFLQERHDERIGPALLEAMEVHSGDEGLDAIAAVLADRDDSFAEAWPEFAAWNAATGARAGLQTQGYPYASRLAAPPLEVSADALLDDDNRFYPLATTYFSLEHAGGPLAVAFADDPAGLVFSLHAVPGGGLYGPTEDAAVVLEPTGVGVVELGEQDAGLWLLAGSYPRPAPESTKVRFCLGAPEQVAACLEEPDDGEADTGGADTGGTEAPEDPSPEQHASGGEGGCTVAPAPRGWAVVLLGLLAVGRRRR